MIIRKDGNNIVMAAAAYGQIAAEHERFRVKAARLDAVLEHVRSLRRDMKAVFTRDELAGSALRGLKATLDNIVKLGTTGG